MAKSEPTLNVNSISRISVGTLIKGEIVSPTDIRIDGTFEGKVHSKVKRQNLPPKSKNVSIRQESVSTDVSVTTEVCVMHEWVQRN